VKVSYEEKKAWLTADESVTDTALVKAVQKAGSYKGKVIERQPVN
jgi:copper chaperone CopZ